MVEEMSRDLEAMRPELAKSVEEAEKMMEQIAIDNASAEET